MMVLSVRRKQLFEALDRVARLETALRQCGEWFREYEAHHQVKLNHQKNCAGPNAEKATLDMVRKVERNRERAEMCEKVLRDGQ